MMGLVGSRMDIPNDDALVRAARTGDRRAYGVLVDRHLPAVYGVARRILCHAADAEDVTQDVFVRALERLDHYDMKHSFRNWLLKIATNLSINEIRARRRVHTFHQRLAQASSESPGPIPCETSVADAWQPWLERLEPSQRAAVVLFHFEQLSYPEVAELLGIPVNTVRTHLYRGRRRLRDLMTRPAAPENGSWNVVK